MPHKIPVSVLVVIHTPDLQVLILERADNPGFWQSVTGSCDRLDEPLEAAAARELHEETGLSLTAGILVDWREAHEYEIYPRWRHRYAPGVTRNTEHVFGFTVPQPVTPTLAPREHTAWRWLPWNEAARAVFSHTNRDAIRALPRRI